MAELHETKATPVAELKRMRVDPNHQHRGYGQRIYDALESTAKERGYRELVLDTSPALAGAQRLYEENGFQRERRIELDAFDGSIELLLYRKPLSD